MGFLDHLEELRWHLVRSALAILALTILAYVFSDFVWNVIIFGPLEPDFWTYRVLRDLAEQLGSPLPDLGYFDLKIQNRAMAGQFIMDIKSSVVIGLCVAFPYAFWEIWRFVRPGLRSNEKKASRGVVFIVSLLFTAGLLFGYFIVTPLSINFLVNYQLSAKIDNIIDITSILGTVGTLSLACGLMFQLPVVTYILSKAGIVTPKLMKRYRRHAIVVILVVSAIITPPDVISQVLIAVPLTFLYEVSIIVSRRIERKREKEEL